LSKAKQINMYGSFNKSGNGVDELLREFTDPSGNYSDQLQRDCGRLTEVHSGELGSITRPEVGSKELRELFECINPAENRP
jgi:hypothetical protein